MEYCSTFIKKEGKRKRKLSLRSWQVRTCKLLGKTIR